MSATSAARRACLPLGVPPPKPRQSRVVPKRLPPVVPKRRLGMRPAKRRFASNPVVPKLCLGMRPREALLRNLNPRRNLGIILKRKLPRRSWITSPTVTLHPRPSQPFSPDDCRGRNSPVMESRNSEVKTQPAPTSSQPRINPLVVPKRCLANLPVALPYRHSGIFIPRGRDVECPRRMQSRGMKMSGIP